jgi:N-acetylgalactosamine-6-sulfatase
MNFPRRALLRIVLFTFAWGLLAGADTLRGATAHPNLLLILADDLGYGDLSSYGAPDCKTPAIDSLAKTGARFTDAYAGFPVCSPSRAALLTGLYPQRFGPTYEDYFGGGSPGLDPARHPTLGTFMKNAGYATACFGKWNVDNYEREILGPLQHGFDKWVGFHLNHNYFTHISKGGEMDFWVDGKRTKREGFTDNILADETVSWLHGRKNQNPTQPFFIYLPFQAPHDPMQSPDGPADQPEFKSKPEQRPLNIKLIENLDKQSARVLDALKEAGLMESTLIIFTSDNGGHKAGRNLPLRGNKQELFEGGVRVPLIISQPGVIAAGQVIHEPVIAMDLTATIATVAGADPARIKGFDGVDLLPLVTGRQEALAERALFWRRRNVDARARTVDLQGKSVRVGPWKLLIDSRKAGKGKPEGKVMLFNLAEDIGEANDLAASNPAMVQSLKQKLSEWESKVDADAAKAPVQLPLSPKGQPVSSDQ